MERINSSGAATDMFGSGKPGFTDGDPDSDTDATQLNAHFMNTVQEELCKIVESTGATLNSSDRTQVWAAIKKVPTQQFFNVGTPSGVYTRPTGVRWIRVQLIGGGGGGSGAGTGSPGSGGSGGNTTFKVQGGAALLVAPGGAGAVGATPGAGGVPTSGAISALLIPGNAGSLPGISSTTPTSPINVWGGRGGDGVFGGGSSSTGYYGTGSGGSGGPTGSTTSSFPGTGGGAGGYVDAIITTPVTSYDFTVGGPGTAGAAGTAGNAGYVGGGGAIIVTEYY